METPNFDAKGIAIMTDVSVSAPAPASAEPKSGPSTEPSPNMTGEEAKAWVDAQKGKAPPAKDPGREAPKAQDVIKEAAAEAKRKLKIDDEEIDEDEVIKTYKDRKGHQQAANKILQEGKQARKQAEEFITMMRDPEKFFEVAGKLGQNPRMLAEKYLAGQLEEELLDPREKEFRATKRELEAIKARDAQIKAENDSKMNEALKAKYAKDYSDQFVSALKEFNLPPTKVTVADMAKYVHDAAQIGFKMTAQEAAQLVKEDIQAKTQRLFAEADGDVLINLLGEQVANKVRKWDTSRLRNPEQNLKTPNDHIEHAPRQRGAPKKRMSASEWRAFNRK